MGRIMSFGQDGRMERDFDKSEHDFLRRYGRTPDEVLAENARLRALCADMVKMLMLACWTSVESDEEASQCIYRAEALGIEVTS